MASTSEGLLAVWLNVPAAHDAEFNDWYNTEHLEQVSSPAGVVSARRYRTAGEVNKTPWYLALYDLASVDVYFGETFQSILTHPTPWARRAARLYGSRRIANVYRKIFQIGEDPPQPPPALLMARMDIDTAVEEEFHEWYNNEHAPRLAQVPGCLRVRRFISVEGAPRFGAIYDLISLDVLKSESWIGAHEYERTRHMHKAMSKVVKRSCELIFALR
jgi:hypothetical protein